MKKCTLIGNREGIAECRRTADRYGRSANFDNRCPLRMIVRSRTATDKIIRTKSNDIATSIRLHVVGGCGAKLDLVGNCNIAASRCIKRDSSRNKLESFNHDLGAWPRCMDT